MYKYLTKYLGTSAARIVAPVLYSILFFSIVYCIFEAQAEFNYLLL